LLWHLVTQLSFLRVRRNICLAGLSQISSVQCNVYMFLIVSYLSVKLQLTSEKKTTVPLCQDEASCLQKTLITCPGEIFD